MHHWKKIRLLFVVALILQLVAAPVIAQAATATIPTWEKPVTYVALGDSLAAGINQNNELGKGYGEFIAEHLAQKGQFKSFNKGFSYPGYTTNQVLADLKANVSKPFVGSGEDDHTLAIQTAIAKADIITISVGANDVLQTLKEQGIDVSKGIPANALPSIVAAVQKVGTNYKAILSEVYKANPSAQVYVMGYYNPFPHLNETAQGPIQAFLTQINRAIQTSVAETTAVFVPTQQAISQNYNRYVPNPENIHLSEAGYQVVAQQFLAKMNNDASKPLKATVKSSTSVDLHWQLAYATGGVTAYKIYQGNELLTEVPGTVSTFAVRGLKPNTVYSFSIVAINSQGQPSEAKPTVQIKTNPEQALTTFTDINGHWAKSDIEKAAELGIIGGYNDGTFKPNNTLTRSQVAMILVRALNLEATKPAPFSDTKGFSPQTKAAIDAAYEFGLVKGSNGQFKPNDPVTRVQLALMISRSYEIVNGKPYVPNNKVPFTDIQNHSPEVQRATAMLAELDIASGSNGKFNPHEKTTRAQAAKMLVNTMEILNK